MATAQNYLAQKSFFGDSWEIETAACTMSSSITHCEYLGTDVGNIFTKSTVKQKHSTNTNLHQFSISGISKKIFIP